MPGRVGRSLMSSEPGNAARVGSSGTSRGGLLLRAESRPTEVDSGRTAECAKAIIPLLALGKPEKWPAGQGRRAGRCGSRTGARGSKRCVAALREHIEIARRESNWIDVESKVRDVTASDPAAARSVEGFRAAIAEFATHEATMLSLWRHLPNDLRDIAYLRAEDRQGVDAPARIAATYALASNPDVELPTRLTRVEDSKQRVNAAYLSGRQVDRRIYRCPQCDLDRLLLKLRL
jgi:hypothetical protein